MTFDEILMDPKPIQPYLTMLDKYSTNWLNYSIDLYYAVAETKHEEKLSNIIIALFFREIQETIDGIRVLHRESCIKPSIPLVRMLFELYVQLAFILKDKDKVEERAVAYELYSLYQSMKRSSESNSVIHEAYEKYNSDREIEMKNLLATDPMLRWHKLCGFKNLKSLCIHIGEEELYNTLYSTLSQHSHGYLPRQRLESTEQGNYLEPYRMPVRGAYQLSICQYVIERCMILWINNFKLIDELDRIKIICDAQREIIKTLKNMESNIEFIEVK